MPCLSVCYGHAANGKMLMNFGARNQNGGERRLNVAFSRAKLQPVALVTSIRHHAITNDCQRWCPLPEELPPLREQLPKVILQPPGGCSGK